MSDTTDRSDTFDQAKAKANEAYHEKSRVIMAYAGSTNSGPVSNGRPLFWNEDKGWTNLQSATRYSSAELNENIKATHAKGLAVGETWAREYHSNRMSSAKREVPGLIYERREERLRNQRQMNADRGRDFWMQRIQTGQAQKMSAQQQKQELRMSEHPKQSHL